jgi:hypothetical protein
MKLFVSLAALWLIVSISPAFAAAPATQPGEDKSVAELKAKVEKLEAEVKDLRTKLAERDKLIDKYVNSAKPLPPKWDELKALNDLSLKIPALPALPPSQRPDTIPPGSVPQQFNGATYYLIPCEAKELRALTGIGQIRSIQVREAAPALAPIAPGNLIDDRAHPGYAIPPAKTETRPTTR